MKAEKESWQGCASDPCVLVGYRVAICDSSDSDPVFTEGSDSDPGFTEGSDSDPIFTEGSDPDSV